MITDYPRDMMALLEAMKGEAWSDAQMQRYTLALSQLPPKLGRAVVQQMCLETWRPSPMDILRAAAKRISPFPSVDEAYAEMMHKAETIGLYGTPDPNNPRCTLPGPPAFSHPLVAQAIQHCGGWRGICSGEAQMQEGLSKQFRGAYERVSAKWIEQVIPALALPLRERPAELFPKWTPYKLPQQWHERAERLAIAPPAVQSLTISEVSVKMPAEIRARLKRIGNSLQEPANAPCELSQTRAEIESELAAIREKMKARATKTEAA